MVDKQQIKPYNIGVAEIIQTEKRDIMSTAAKNVVRAFKKTFEDCAFLIDEVVMRGQL